jgi:hypothetical protein
LLNYGLNKSGLNVGFINSTYAGKANGLQITMYLGVVEKLKAFYPGYGLKIKIDNGTNKISNDFIEIPPGYETNIVVEREIIQQLPTPYSNCELDNDNPIIKDAKLFNILSELNITYKQSICLELCYQTLMKDNCNCTDPQYESFYDDVDICHDGESWACLSDIYFNFVNGNYSDTFCKQQCPLECIKTRYYFSTSSNKINIDYYSKTIDEYALKNGIINENETLSLEDKSNSIIKFNI